MKRVRQPLNTIDPYTSLLTPLYNYDIERAMKERVSLRATPRPPRNVQVAEESSRKSLQGPSQPGSTADTPDQHAG